MPLQPQSLRLRGERIADKPLEYHQDRLSRQFLPLHFGPKPKLVRRPGVLLALRTRFLPTGREASGSPGTDDRPGLANPKRTSTAPRTKHATAVNRNVGSYADPSLEMYPEERSRLYFIQIPQPPQAIQIKPNSKQRYCSATTIAGFVGVPTSFWSELSAGRTRLSRGLLAMSAQASTGDLNWASAFSSFASSVITTISRFGYGLNIQYAFRYTLSL
jgi:hypothetical protein